MCGAARPSVGLWNGVLLGLMLALAAEELTGQEEEESGDTPIANRVSLETCIAIALENQPAIQLRAANVGVARANTQIARSYRLPQIDAALRYTALDEPLTVSTPGVISGAAADVFSDAAAYFGIARQAGPAVANAALASPNTGLFAAAKQAALAGLPGDLETDLLGANFLTAQVTLTQAIWTGGKIRFRQEQAAVGVQVGAQEVEKAKQETVFQVTRAYWGVLLAEALLEVADASEAKFQVISDVADNLNRANDPEITRPDVLRPLVLAQLARTEREKLLAARATAYTLLRQAMGMGQDYELTVADKALPAAEVALDVSELMDRALRCRPEVIQTSLGLRAAQLECELATAQFRPDVGLFATFTAIVDDQDYRNPTNPNLGTAGVAAELPLGTGGRRTAQLRKAQCQLRQAHHLHQLVRQHVESEVQQAFLEYRDMASRLRHTKVAVRQAGEALTAYESQFAGDQLEDNELPQYFQDVVETRLLLTHAETQHLQNLYGFHTAVAKAFYASGQRELAAIVHPAE